MAKRNRYREMESLMTRVIIGDALVFALYLLCAGFGWTVLKVTTFYALAGWSSPASSPAAGVCGW